MVAACGKEVTDLQRLGDWIFVLPDDLEVALDVIWTQEELRRIKCVFELFQLSLTNSCRNR